MSPRPYCRTEGLFILAGKGKDRIFNKGKGNVAEGKGNKAEMEFKNLFINSMSGTVSRVG